MRKLLGILLGLLGAGIHTLAFVELRVNSNYLRTFTSRRLVPLGMALKDSQNGRRSVPPREDSRTDKISKNQMGTKQEKTAQSTEWKPSNHTIIPSLALKELSKLPSGKVDGWMRRLTIEGKFSNPPIFSCWNIQEQIDFVKYLKTRNAYDAILLFLDNLGQLNVKVGTTAMFAMALSKIHRDKAYEILERLDSNAVVPTPLTFIALLGSVDGPKATEKAMAKIESYKKVKLNAEVFNSAIYALHRTPQGGARSDGDWKMALNLMQSMRRKQIKPTSKTYHAALLVLARTGKVQIAKSLLQQLKNTPHLEPDDKIVSAAINVCAQASDYKEAIIVVKEMQDAGFQPNLRHCSALLNAFAKSGQDEMALAALSMMLGEERSSNCNDLRLPKVTPDLVALNTVLSACSRAKNAEAATALFERMKEGEFVDPFTDQTIVPDLISYHNMLIACQDQTTAKDLVKEMRLSRRRRYGATPPTHVSYAHAISVCQKESNPDLELVDTLFQWAIDDGVRPTVYMFSSAIWAAQKSRNSTKAMKYYSQMTSYGFKPNHVVYSGIISVQCDAGNIEGAIELYLEAKHEKLQLSRRAYKSFASAILSLDNRDEQQTYLEKVFVTMQTSERSVVVGGPVFEALIANYGSQGLFDKALAVFDQIVGQADAGCLRAILHASSMTSPPRWRDGITLLHASDIIEEASGPGRVDQVALSSAILSCSKADEFEEGLNLLQLYGIQVDKRESKSPSLSIVALNSLIAACGRGHRPDLAMAIFNEMEPKFGLKPDIRTYRSAVIACNQAEHKRQRSRSVYNSGVIDEEDSINWWECALALLRRMREDEILPDTRIYSSVISACEAAGEWQRALGILQMMINDDARLGRNASLLNIFCFNAALSACEKGGAWVESLELYETMIETGGPIAPNFVTLSSLIVALDKAGQKELAQSKYEEGRKEKIVNPWRRTRNNDGGQVIALDLHTFSAAMAKAAIRSAIDSYVTRARSIESVKNDLIIITGKGLNSLRDPVLKAAVLEVLTKEHRLNCHVDHANPGRVVVEVEALREYISTRS